MPQQKLKPPFICNELRYLLKDKYTFCSFTTITVFFFFLKPHTVTWSWFLVFFRSTQSQLDPEDQQQQQRLVSAWTWWRSFQKHRTEVFYTACVVTLKNWTHLIRRSRNFLKDIFQRTKRGLKCFCNIQLKFADNSQSLFSNS